MFTVAIIQNPKIQNAALQIVKIAGTYNYHWAIKGYTDTYFGHIPSFFFLRNMLRKVELFCHQVKM
jgi:hypothetical protein